MKRCFALVLFLVTAITCFSTRLRAQAMGASISGTVIDPSGAAVPDADLTLIALGTRAEAKVKSSADGGYSFQNLLTGPYGLHVSAKGFKDYDRTGILVNINAKLRVDVPLELGAATQVVEVSANASPLNYESPEQKGTIAPQNIEQLPLILSGHTRTAVAFARLLPGAVSGGDEDNLNFNTRINGGTNEGDEAIWDGVTIVDGSLGQNGIELAVTGHPMSPEAIQEITLLTANYDAQFGSTSSSVLTAVTKSGTNSWHGSGYGLVRNTALNARQWGLLNKKNSLGQEIPGTARPADIETDFGGTVGGPVKIPRVFWTGRKKTYMFVNYEGFRLHGGVTAPIVSVPTMQERQGDFRDWVDQSTGQIIPIYDPATTRLNPAYNPGLPPGPNNIQYLRDQFMGCNGTTPNVICSTDPRLQASLAPQWLKYVPAPNLPGILNNYTPPQPPTGTVNADSTVIDVRADHYVGDKDHVQVTVHYFGSFGNNQTIFPAQIASESFRQPNYDFADRLGWDHTFRPNLVNNFNLGYNDILSIGVCSDKGQAGAVPKLPGVLNNAFPPVIGISSFRGFGCNGDFNTTRPAYIANDRMTWVRGKHTIGMGGEYRALLDKEISISNLSGNFSFIAKNTGLREINSGSGLASFLLGYVNSASMNDITLGDQHIRQKYVASYASDTWRITRKLTLNYGARWDISTPSREKYNRVSFIDPNMPNSATNNRPGVVRWAGSYAAGASLGGPYPDATWLRGIAPRVGFAYALTPRTVVRAGYGVFYQMLEYPGWSSGISGGRDGFNTTASLISPDGGFTPAGLLSNGMVGVTYPKPPFFSSTFDNGRYPGLYRQFGTARPPYMQQYNLTVERQFTSDFYMSGAYVANKGTRIISQLLPLNVIPLNYLSLGNQLNDRFLDSSGNELSVVDGIQEPYAGWAKQMTQCTPSVAQALLPYPQFCGNLYNLGEDAGNSTYHSFQLKAEKRWSHGFWLLTSYTWSKFISSGADIQATANNFGAAGAVSPFQRSRFKMLDPQDSPQTLAASLVYELPFGAGKRWLRQGGHLDKVLSGWQFTTVWHSSAGLPLLFYSSNCNIPGQFRASCIPGVLPGASPFAQDKGGFNPSKPLFNRASFENGIVPGPTGPQFGLFNFATGQGGRTTSYRGFPYHNQNIALEKTTSVTERVKFQFRAEFFNLWNWHFFSRGTTWGEGGALFTDVASPLFGMPTGNVTAPRNIQMGAKFIF